MIKSTKEFNLFTKPGLSAILVERASGGWYLYRQNAKDVSEGCERVASTQPTTPHLVHLQLERVLRNLTSLSYTPFHSLAAPHPSIAEGAHTE